MSARHHSGSGRPVSHQPGPHERGQNFLRDRRVIRAMVDLAAQGHHPLVEWAAGDGALTMELATLGRPMEVVEIDSRCVARFKGEKSGLGVRSDQGSSSADEVKML